MAGGIEAIEWRGSSAGALWRDEGWEDGVRPELAERTSLSLLDHLRRRLGTRPHPTCVVRSLRKPCLACLHPSLPPCEARQRDHARHPLRELRELIQSTLEASPVELLLAAPTSSLPLPAARRGDALPAASPPLATMVRITTWNVNGIRNPFAYQPWRETRTFAAMFNILEADIVVMQELKIQRKDLTDDMVLVPGWDCYFSLPKHKKGRQCIRVPAVLP